MNKAETAVAGIESVLTARGDAHSLETQRAFHANRLQQRLDDSTQAAQRAGMTPEILETLLNDER